MKDAFMTSTEGIRAGVTEIPDRTVYPDGELHIALTGHRPDKLDGYTLSTPFYKKMAAAIRAYVLEVSDGYDRIWLHSGLALGADTVFAIVALHLKYDFPDRFFFYAEVPSLTQASVWKTQSDRDLWARFCRESDDHYVYADTYTHSCMQRRNIGMLNHADILIEIYDGTPGGTGNTVKYADKQVAQGVPLTIKRFHPNLFR